VYACHGFSNTSTIKAQDGSTITMNSGNTYRFQPDGSHVEQFTWGQVNPFGLSLDWFGNLYSADCHSQPIYHLLRGAYYPSFGKPHDGLGFGPEMYTGYKRSTAVAGVVYYAADHFPPAYRGTAFIGDVVTNDLVQFRLRMNGATPRATEHTFLHSTDPWFRPVDIKLGPDGALYVADFYNRIIGHYEVPLNHPGRDRHRGRIWRIVYTGKDHKGTPAPRQDWTKASLEELIADLNHPSLTVELLALNQLVARKDPKATKLLQALFGEPGKVPADTPMRRANALWALERLGTLDDTILERATRYTTVEHVHALRVLGERRTLNATGRKLLLAGLKASSARVCRAAGEALARHPHGDHIVPLQNRLAQLLKAGSKDTHLIHTLRIALREQLRPAENWKAIESREGALPLLMDMAVGVPTPEAAGFLLQQIRKHSYPTDRLVAYVHHAARHGQPETRLLLFEFARKHHPRDLGMQAVLFRAIERGTQESGKPLPREVRSWGVELTGKLLASSQPGEVKQGIELVGSLHVEGQQAMLVKLAQANRTPEDQRLAALNALAALDIRRHAAVLGKVLADASSPMSVREQAANLLARANQTLTREELLAALPAAPARLQNTIAARLATSREGAEKLLGAIATGKASARLLQERAVLVPLESARVPNLKARLAKLTAGLPSADKRLSQLLAARRKGFLAARKDVAVGAKVYEKHCASCHQLGGKGAKVGPQLDGIGVRGLDRLLEDVLDPNRNVDQAFRTTVLNLKDGRTVTGLLLREEGAVLVLADSQGKEVRVEKKKVEERTTSQMSPMPANFNDTIPEADFHHLMAYLLAQKASRP
jgi:putative heme-binding domain-containing protein